MTLERRKPLERRKGIAVDPAKVRAWQGRSRKPIPRESARRRSERPVRAAVRRLVLERDGRCQAAGLAPGRCWHPVGEPLDVHEVVRRSRWRDAHLHADNCLALCRGHHDWVTIHDKDARPLGLTASRRPRRVGAKTSPQGGTPMHRPFAPDKPRPTSAFAWSVMTSRHVDFEVHEGPHALVYLAVAELCDRRLNSPVGLMPVSAEEVAELLPTVGVGLVFKALRDLTDGGLLVFRDGLGVGWAFPEEAWA